MASSALVDSTGASAAGLGQGVVLREVRGDVDRAKSGEMVAGVIGLVLADRDAPASLSGFALEHCL